MKPNQEYTHSQVVSAWPFYLASIILLLSAASIWRVAYLWDDPRCPSWQLVATVGFLIIVSALLFVWPHVLKARLQTLIGLPESVRQLEHILSDADNVLRSYGKARTSIEALRESVETEKQSFTDIQETILKDLMDYRQKDLELQEKRRECERMAIEIDSWVNTSVDYFDYLQRVLDNYSTDESRVSLADKIATTYDKLVSSRALARICPAAGDPFLDELHEAEREQPADGVPPGHVIDCVEWGYRFGTEVMKRAKVVLSK